MIITYSLTGENANEFHGGLWEAVSDVKLCEAPKGLESEAIYEQTFAGTGKTAKEAVENLVYNLRAHGYSGVLRRLK